MIPLLAPLVTLLQPLIQPIIAALPKIGAAVAKFVAKIPQPIIDKVISVSIDIICDLAKRLLGCSDTPAELGDKALKAEKKPEDFEKTSDYIKYLENEIKIDRVEFQKLTPEERSTRELTGTEIYRQGISEKVGFDMTDEFLVLCGKAGLDAKTVYMLIDELQGNRSITLGDVCSYFAGTCQPDKIKETGNLCKRAFIKSLDNPTTEEVNKKILTLMEEAGKVY